MKSAAAAYSLSATTSLAANSFGNFKHPFANEHPSVNTVHNPDTQTFSVKLKKA